MRTAGLCLLVVAAGCKPRALPAPDAGEPEHGALVHDHPSPHGGRVASTARGHLELLLDAAGRVQVWVYDQALSPRPLAGLQGALFTSLPATPKLPLTARGDHFAAELPAPPGRSLALVVTIKGPLGTEVARFAEPRAAPPAPPPAIPQGQRFVGRLLDATCLARGELPGPEHTECAVRCIKNGSPITLLQENGQGLVLAGGAEGEPLVDQLLPYVGRRVTVYGEKRQNAGTEILLVSGVVPEHDHTPHQGGQVAMMGDVHLEVLLDDAGEVRAYLSDAFRHPLPAETPGTVEIKLAESSGDPERFPLSPGPEKRYLAARVGARPPREHEVTVRVPLPGEPDFFISFLLTPQAPGAGGQAPLPQVPGEIRVEVAGGYSPSEIRAKKGLPLRLRFVRKDSSGCTRELLIPGLGIRQELAGPGETLVEIVPPRSGTLEFTCGMQMLKGRILVED